MNEINWFLPLLVFFARVLDVSLGTLRIIFINKGKRLLVMMATCAVASVLYILAYPLLQN